MRSLRVRTQRVSHITMINFLFHIKKFILVFIVWEEPKKRTLGPRQRQILWKRAGGKCEACDKQISYLDMQVGHKTAYSKGGSTTLRNSVCLCYTCNKLQGTDSFSTFLKKLGKSSPVNEARDVLKTLTVVQLKELAKMHKISVKGKKEEGWFRTTVKPPTKSQYISAIAKKVSLQDINSSIKNLPAPAKLKRKRRSTY